jgi:hypothetical protein
VETAHESAEEPKISSVLCPLRSAIVWKLIWQQRDPPCCISNGCRSSRASRDKSKN